MPLLDGPVVLPATELRFPAAPISGARTQAAGPQRRRRQIVDGLPATAIATDRLPATVNVIVRDVHVVERDECGDVAIIWATTSATSVTTSAAPATMVAASTTMIAAPALTVVASATMLATSEFKLTGLVYGPVVGHCRGRLVVCSRIQPNYSWSSSHQRGHYFRLKLFL